MYFLLYYVYLTAIVSFADSEFTLKKSHDHLVKSSFTRDKPSGWSSLTCLCGVELTSNGFIQGTGYKIDQVIQNFTKFQILLKILIEICVAEFSFLIFSSLWRDPNPKFVATALYNENSLIM